MRKGSATRLPTANTRAYRPLVCHGRANGPAPSRAPRHASPTEYSQLPSVTPRPTSSAGSIQPLGTYSATSATPGTLAAAKHRKSQMALLTWPLANWPRPGITMESAAANQGRAEWRRRAVMTKSFLSYISAGGRGCPETEHEGGELQRAHREAARQGEPLHKCHPARADAVGRPAVRCQRRVHRDVRHEALRESLRDFHQFFAQQGIKIGLHGCPPSEIAPAAGVRGASGS